MCWNNQVASLIMPSSLLKVVNSLLHTCNNLCIPIPCSYSPLPVPIPHSLFLFPIPCSYSPFPTPRSYSPFAVSISHSRFHSLFPFPFPFLIPIPRSYSPFLVPNPCSSFPVQIPHLNSLFVFPITPFPFPVSIFDSVLIHRLYSPFPFSFPLFIPCFPLSVPIPLSQYQERILLFTVGFNNMAPRTYQ